MAAATSPRLPSPPPLTEVQFGPGSDESAGQLRHASRDEHGDDSGVTRRVRPGSKALDMAAGPPLIPLAQLDSPFQLQEHLKALHSHFTRPEGSDTVTPIHRDVAVRLAEPPEGVDRALWLYELCRFLTMKLNNLIVAFFTENPPCSSQTCPEMQASEWQYLCAVHDPPKTCCAIDYCCHTLDWATNILTSTKFFPSRLTLGSEATGGPQASMRHLVNIFRRLYRIFAHAWFKHRQVFWQVEGNEGLYIFFKTVCDVYHLMPEDSYTVPPEAEGIVSQPSSKTAPAEDKPAANPRMSILKRGGDENSLRSSSIEDLNEPGATTRRHKHSPSTGSRVTTITEDSEEASANAAAMKEDAAAEKTEQTEQSAVQEPQDDLAEQADAVDETKPEPVSAEDELESLSTGQEELYKADTQTVIGIQPSEVNGEGDLVSEQPLSETAPESAELESKTEPESKTEAKEAEAEAEAEEQPEVEGQPEVEEQPKEPEESEPEEPEKPKQPEQPESETRSATEPES